MPPPPGMVEPMAKDLVDEETDFASDYDIETSSTATTSSISSLYNINQIQSDEQEQKEVDFSVDALPSIEELTRNMQDLTEKDLLLSNGFDSEKDKHNCKEDKIDNQENTGMDNSSQDRIEEISINVHSSATESDNRTQNDDIENEISLEKEIENLLAPLSKEVSITPNNMDENNSTSHDVGEKVVSAIGGFIESNDGKKHNVTPTNTKTDFIESNKKSGDANVTPNDGYIQYEKRARLGSLSDSSSSCSSSPFELCEAQEGAVVIEHHAVIEATSSGKLM